MFKRLPHTSDEPLSRQVGARLSRKSVAPKPATSERVVSTGSTLLDLAISGGRYPEGGIPGGYLVEVFGPPGSGKTVLMCEMAGNVQHAGGEVMFMDPEGRLNAQFASRFGFEVSGVPPRPDTVPELFSPVRSWKPRANGGAINAVFADSLAALSTDLEMSDEGDKRGQRRAKEFSEQCRLTCRVLAKCGYLMVASNQVRQNIVDGVPFAEKYTTSGGLAIPHYASLRLRAHSPSKVPREVKIGGKEHKRVVGVATTFEVYKSSIWEPYHSAKVYILFDYGVDDLRANLEFVKLIAGSYMLSQNERLSNGLDRSIEMVEEGSLEPQLKRYTIQLWREMEERFKVSRRPKRRE